MNVRDFVIKVTFVENLSGKIAWFNFVSGDGGFCASVDEVERAASAYAAKAAPAPVSTAWEPKRGEQVLVEAEVVDEVDEYGEATIDLCSVKPMYFPRCVVNRSAIVGPAPVRARFAVGDTAFCVSTMARVTVYDNVGKNQWRVTNGEPTIVWLADDSDLLTMDEARERLSNNG